MPVDLQVGLISRGLIVRRDEVHLRLHIGGTRSQQGTDTKMTLASLFGTWRAQGLNPLAACRQLLASPQL